MIHRFIDSSYLFLPFYPYGFTKNKKLALLILQNSPPTSGRLLEKQPGSAAQYGNHFDFLHLAHVVFDKAKYSCVHLATPVSISASGQSAMLLLVKVNRLQTTSHAIVHIFIYCYYHQFAQTECSPLHQGLLSSATAYHGTIAHAP